MGSSSTMFETRSNPATATDEARLSPLSFAQQRLWFLDQLEPDGSVYNVFIGLRLRGPLNFDALQRSLNEIVRRHEVLRAGFPSVGGQPVQVISTSLTLPLSVVDLTNLPASERENEAHRSAKAEAEKPFNLARGPLLRATLLRLALEDHVLLLTLHHIVYDAWSNRILYRELTVLYEAFSKGCSSPLAELPVQYVDFTQWQRKWLQQDALKEQLSYWKKHLEGVATLQLPIDRRRPLVQSFRGASQSIVLSRELTTSIKALSQRGRATLFMTLLAAFKVLLFRYTGQDDVAVGTPIANRSRIELEELIGFLINTLVLRTDLARNPSFLELLSRVREVALEAYAHQDLPFERLVEELNPERVLNQTPLFQVLFVFQNDAVRDLKLSGLTARRFTVESSTTKFDLTLSMAETDEGLLATVQYNSDLFEAGTIQRMLGHFRNLLNGIVANPNQPVSSLPLLSQSERRQLLLEWNDTDKAYAPDKCLHQLFEEQVERTPEAVAAVFQSQEVTYLELNRRANQLAHRLRKLGIAPEVPVGICVERGLEMVVGVLGILKAGGTYVPLDPTYPKERLAFVLADSKAAALLTQANLSASLPEPKTHVIYLDRDSTDICRESDANPPRKASAGNLAYLIYTSGSTGSPKGVGIEHHSATALVHWAREVFTPADLAGVLASTSLCFDLSVFELFVPLSTGGKVIVAENALQLSNLSRAAEVTLINTVPSVLSELLKLDGLPPSVRTVNLAGEPLSPVLVDQLYQQKTIERVYDLYGPSEDTTYSTFALRRSHGPAIIGRPIANTKVYLLDSHLNPVPIGVVGELWLAGEGLARGYWERADSTADAFMPNPFSSEPGARLYKTGDLARYLPDGNVEFLGRIDHQVKVRGFRIELGEIESVLVRHSAVDQAVVTVQEDSPGNRRLVAHIISNEKTADFTDLGSFLKQKLPSYMVPSSFVFLDALPVTPNGKIDRKSLLVLDQIRPELNTSFVAPRYAVEKAVAEIWAQILKVDRVGVHDNFFDLGGHSLLAIQVVSRLREAFSIEIPLRAMFENTTVAELAMQIQEQVKNSVSQKMVHVLTDLESVSDEEAERLLAQESFKSAGERGKTAGNSRK